MFEHFVCLLIQGAALELRMAQGQCPVAAGVDRPHLDIRFAVAQVVLLGQLLAHITVAASSWIADTSSLSFLSSSSTENRVEFADQACGDRYWAMKLSSLKLRIAKSRLARQSLPASSGNQARSSSVGCSQIRRISLIMANPSAYGLMPL